jgi:predicted HTH domain antitoxin
MHAVKIHELKNNPSEALRQAKKAPVIVMKDDQPEAVIFHLDSDVLLAQPGMRLALAISLFKEGHLPLGRAARLAELPLVEFIAQLSRERIPVITGTPREAREDMETLRKWRKSS